MKRALLLTAFLLLASNAFAERRWMVAASTNTSMVHTQSYVSEGHFYSSTTCGASALGSVIVSTTAGSVHVISVSSAGVGSFLQVFDARAATTTARVIKMYVNTTVARDHLMNVQFSSGLAVSNQGAPGGAGVPACIDVIYEEQ